jgi:hypothetical protein
MSFRECTWLVTLVWLTAALQLSACRGMWFTPSKVWDDAFATVPDGK